MLGEALVKVNDAVSKFNPDTATADSSAAVVADMKDALADLLDQRFGSTVNDPSIFTSLTQHWEAEFHADMAALNVQPPDVLTRVTEYLPQIVTYVQKIIDNGFAYESNGSVYFNVAAFSKSGNTYAKLCPEAVGQLAALAEGEGELSAGTKEKRNERDFALWKASKSGEPAWPSPWGQGRPGWHIECSVMACDILGETMDIHSGGVDLKFPHHDNEIAQAEAHYGHHQWVTYFLHSGHLHIEGKKMSKSLKNFKTIKEELVKYSARQIRLAFLTHKWMDVLDFADSTMEQMFGLEKTYNEFFLTIKAEIAKSGKEQFTKWTQLEKDLEAKFSVLKEDVHTALCDSIDTVTTMLHLRTLVADVHEYLHASEKARNNPSTLLLRRIAQYVTKMFSIFGLFDSTSGIGFGGGPSQQDAFEEAIMPSLQAFASFRDEIRKIALPLKAKEILTLCDKVRDEDLPKIGVRLEDKQSGAVVKLVDKDDLLREKQRELEEKEAKALAKAEAAAKVAAEEQKKRLLAQTPPEALWLNDADYSQRDERGIPTHDKTGEPVSKSKRKALEKQFAEQEKLRAKYLK